MALKATYNLKTYKADTAAEIADKVFASNELVTALDTGATKKGDGVTKFSLLPVFSGVGSVTAATPTVVGGILKMPVQADSVATTIAGLVTDFNALLAKARTAGILS